MASGKEPCADGPPSASPALASRLAPALENRNRTRCPSMSAAAPGHIASLHRAAGTWLAWAGGWKGRALANPATAHLSGAPHESRKALSKTQQRARADREKFRSPAPRVGPVQGGQAAAARAWSAPGLRGVRLGAQAVVGHARGIPRVHPGRAQVRVQPRAAPAARAGPGCALTAAPPRRPARAQPLGCRCHLP